MATRASSGFTIIETLLFLGITGLLVLGALIGTGANVNIQRYRDATETFKATMQDQYADTANVQNGRQGAVQCNTSAGIVNNPAGEEKGQSPCVVVGRYVRVIGGDISSYTVLAREQTVTTPTTDDLVSLRTNYRINIAREEVDERTMEWGTSITWPSTVAGLPAATGDSGGTPGSSRSIALLFIRSPDSGQTYTFTSNTVPTDAAIDGLSPTTAPAFLRDMIVAGATAPAPNVGQRVRILCINSNDLFHDTMALYISPYASSSSAIELMSNNTMASKGISARC